MKGTEVLTLGAWDKPFSVSLQFINTFNKLRMRKGIRTFKTRGGWAKVYGSIRS